VKYFSLKSALARHVSPVVTLLEIHVPEAWLLVGDYLNPEDVVSLLRAAARLEPEQFVFSIPNILTQGDIGVPCFRRASSIVLESHNTVALRMPRGINFIALDTLSLSGYIVGLDDLIPQCPRLRVLQLTGYHKNNLVNVHAPSLQELFVDRGYAHRIDIVAPVLRKLSVSLRPNKQVKVSILAPTVETISWRCSYYYRDVAHVLKAS
jgi:hypothetical protein